jgi:ABC-type amino acid transport substrate-binding protein
LGIALLAAEPGWTADLAEIKARGVLRVIAAADEAAETFSFAGGAQPGFDRELVEGFAKLHGLRLEPVKAPSYAERIPVLLSGEGDLIVAIFDTEDRRQQVDFTVEVMPTHNVAVTVAGRPAIGAVADLGAPSKWGPSAAPSRRRRRSRPACPRPPFASSTPSRR